MSEADQRGDMENKQGFRAGSVPERDPQLQASQLSRGQRMEVLSHSCGVLDSWAEDRNGSVRTVNVAS